MYEVIKYNFTYGFKTLCKCDTLKQAENKLINALYEVNKKMVKGCIPLIKSNQIGYYSNGYICIEENSIDVDIIDVDIMEQAYLVG